MDLSPEEQSFFAAGDALAGNHEEPEAPQRSEREGSHRDEQGRSHRHRSRRRRSITRRLRRKLRNNTGWRKTALSVILTIVAVGAGYWASLFVANRDVPTPTDLGVEARP